MAIVDKLKSLYVKMGGDENASASNIEEWVNKLEEVAGNGNSGQSYMIGINVTGVTKQGPMFTLTIDNKDPFHPDQPFLAYSKIKDMILKGNRVFVLPLMAKKIDFPDDSNFSFFYHATKAIEIVNYSSSLISTDDLNLDIISNATNKVVGRIPFTTRLNGDEEDHTTFESDSSYGAKYYGVKD